MDLHIGITAGIVFALLSNSWITDKNTKDIEWLMDHHWIITHKIDNGGIISFRNKEKELILRGFELTKE